MKTIRRSPGSAKWLLPCWPCFASPETAWADKYASIVVDLESGQVMHDRSADEPRHPASLTKVMTLYLVFDAIDSGKLKLSERIRSQRPPRAPNLRSWDFESGSTIKVEDAIRALVTKSANDVAIVLAEKLGGSETKFVTRMNAKAKELGMLNTTFRNASGLPDETDHHPLATWRSWVQAIYMDHKNRYNYFRCPPSHGASADT